METHPGPHLVLNQDEVRAFVRWWIVDGRMVPDSVSIKVTRIRDGAQSALRLTLGSESCLAGPATAAPSLWLSIRERTGPGRTAPPRGS